MSVRHADGDPVAQVPTAQAASVAKVAWPALPELARAMR